MSHEGTTGVMAEAVATDVQAIMQAVVSGPNGAVPVADVRAALMEEGKGTVVRPMEGIRDEVGRAASGVNVPEPLTQTSSGAGMEPPALPATHAVTRWKEPVAEAQEGTEMVRTALMEKVPTKDVGAEQVVSKARLNANVTRTPRKRAKSKAATKSIARAPVTDADSKVRKAKAAARTPGGRQAQALPTMKARKTKSPQTTPEFTVPEVWRAIVKKNERQGSKRYDVLVCQHAVPANDNTYRTARACPECRLTVQRYADRVPAARARKATRRKK